MPFSAKDSFISIHLSSIRRSDVIKYVIAATILFFCFVNIYRSTTQQAFSSSHDYFRKELVRDAWNRSNSVWKSFRVSRKPTENYEERLEKVGYAKAEDYPAYNLTVDGVEREVPLWQRKLAARQAAQNGTEAETDDDDYYFLVELLQVRIYVADKARWSVNELKQWLHFLFLAGVEHVYVCDHFLHAHERLDAALRRYIAARLVTYLPRGAVRDPMTAQIQCYQHIISRYKRRHRWHIAIDMDEYPFSFNDTVESFLPRYLARLPPLVTEVSLPNHLMLGRGDRSGALVVERILRMTPRAANDLVKPIYRPQRVHANVHRNHLLSGRVVEAEGGLRMLHYWGARGQHWGEDTPKIIAQTRVMTDMRDVWAGRVRNSLVVCGAGGALTNSTGP